MSTTEPQRPMAALPERDDDIIYPSAIPFVIVHLACLGALWSGVTGTAVAIGVGLYLARMFAVTGGYHRYFSHKSYKTSRAGQFAMAVLCQSTWQKGVLWWAAKHRKHHKYSDMPEDVHSPRQSGFLFAHMGWIFARERGEAEYEYVPDLMKYPELVWLNNHQHIVPAALAVVVYLAAGWPGLFIGFFLSTVLLFHGTFAINSLAHVVGSQRYVTGDDSRNNFWLALVTLGEGWHNNHHFYQQSTRQGFRWWEIDVTFYVLKVLSWTGLVWDLKSPPPEVVRGERRLGPAVIERSARQLVEQWSTEALVKQLQEHWVKLDKDMEEMRGELEAALERGRAGLAELEWPELPEFPSIEELRAKAGDLFAETPSLDDIAHKAHELLVEAIVGRLEESGGLAPA